MCTEKYQSHFKVQISVLENTEEYRDNQHNAQSDDLNVIPPTSAGDQKDRQKLKDVTSDHDRNSRVKRSSANCRITCVVTTQEITPSYSF